MATFASVVAWVFLGTFLPFYWALAQQVTVTWIKGRPNGLSLMLALFGMLNCLTFPLYGAIQRPPQWISVAAMVPVTVLWPGLWLQRRWPRPSRSLCLLWGLAVVATLGLVGVGLAIPNPSRLAVNVVGLVSAVIGAAVAVVGASGQYKEDRTTLRAGRIPELEMSIYTSTVLSYSVGVVFAVVTYQPWLLITESFGTVLWGACLYQRLKNAQPKEYQPLFEPGEVFFP